MEVVGEGLFRGQGMKFVVVPPSVVKIGADAFRDCACLWKLEFSGESRLEWIGPRAFYNSGIGEFAAPPSLRVIRELAFARCACLTRVELNRGLRVLGSETGKEEEDSGAFMGSAIQSVVVPSTVRRIGGYCFQNCQSLASVTLSRGTEVIGRRSFRYCAFREVVIPRTVTEIEEYVFMHKTKFVRLSFEPGSQLRHASVQDFPFPTVHLVEENAPLAALAVWSQRY